MKQIRNRTVFVWIVSISFLVLGGFSTALIQIPFPDLTGKLDEFYRRYPQQKSYLHLDKLAYRAGETIWYKAYLVDARTHTPDSISKNLVVELVSSFGQSTMIQLLKLENGSGKGDFLLPDTIPQGLYRIRAYTNWMRNFGESYFYSRDINIWNEELEAALYRDDKLVNKRHKKKSQRKAGRVDVQFFPEGGYIVDGLKSRVGFKGINELGLGIDIEGEILAGRDRTVASFGSTHLGMGSFEMIPEKGTKYTARIRDENGKNIRVKLPEIIDEGFVLHLASRDESGMNIEVQGTSPRETFFLAVHVRGNLVHTGEYALQDGMASIAVPLQDAPAGIMHITLFDSQRIPRCERIAFIPPDNLLDVRLRTGRSEYTHREQVTIDMDVLDASGDPIEGNFSMAVSTMNLENHAGDFQGGIVSHLLLTSDLTGLIEQPDFYLSRNDAGSREALDLLMLTQGWRRFIWDDVISEQRLEINYPIQRGLVIQGRITKDLFGIPLKNNPVTLTILSEFNDVFHSRTDSEGKYSFQLPDYEDTVQVEITASRPNGRKNLVIHLDNNNFPENEILFSSYSRDMTIQGTNIFKPHPPVEVDSMKPTSKGLYTEADYVLEVDKTMWSYNSVFDIIKGRIPGVQVNGETVVIRGVNTILGSTDPLFLIDNIPVDIDAVRNLNPVDVERIEVLKGPSASIYGVRGANGVIAIFTKRGRFLIKGKLTFDMLGYHKAREFYKPKYGSEYDHLIRDERATVYWDPEVHTDASGHASVSFYNSDISGDFHIIVEGITNEGEIGRTESSYRVR